VPPIPMVSSSGCAPKTRTLLAIAPVSARRQRKRMTPPHPAKGPPEPAQRLKSGPQRRTVLVGTAISAAVLAASLAVLARAATFAIASFEELLERTGLKETTLGLVVMALMTTTPEISTAVFSVLQGTPGLSVGDVLGSNLFNIGVVVGILATMGALESVRSDLIVEMVDILFLTSAIPVLLVAPPIFQYATSCRLIGAALLSIYAFSVYRELRAKVVSPSPGAARPRGGGWAAPAAKAALGVAIVIAAARAATWSAAELALALGVPPILIGAKIVAIGTSLPELALCVTAARRGRVELALGDVVGANLNNLTLILGLVLLASPFDVDLTVFAELLPFVLLTTLILWKYLTKGGVPRWVGIALLLIYVVFQAVVMPIH